MGGQVRTVSLPAGFETAAGMILDVLKKANPAYVKDSLLFTWSLGDFVIVLQLTSSFDP